MTDPRMPQDKSFEEEKDPIEFKNFKIQDIEWGDYIKDPVFELISRIKEPLVHESQNMILKGDRIYCKNEDGDDDIEVHLKIFSGDLSANLSLDLYIYEDGIVTTTIIKRDQDHKLPKGLGIDLYEKLNSFFMNSAKNDDIGFDKKAGQMPRTYTHEIICAPDVSNVNPLSIQRWYDIFGLYLSKHRYEFNGKAGWNKLYPNNNLFGNVEFLDFDWEDEPVYDGKEKDIRIRPSIFQESIKVDGLGAIIEGSSRKYYKVSSEGKKLSHELVDLKLTIGQASVTIKLKFEGSQVSSEIIPGNSEHQIDQEVIDSFVSKLDHYLKFKAIEDEHDYEHEGKVYKAGEEAEKKLVKEYLQGQGVKLSDSKDSN